MDREQIVKLLKQQTQKRDRYRELFHQTCGAIVTLETLLSEYDREDVNEQNGE